MNDPLINKMEAFERCPESVWLSLEVKQGGHFWKNIQESVNIVYLQEARMEGVKEWSEGISCPLYTFLSKIFFHEDIC